MKRRLQQTRTVVTVLVLFLLGLLAASPLRAESRKKDQIPEILKQWASPEHPVRYFLKVEAPPLAGSLDLQPIPTVAHVYLPLATYAPRVPSAGKGEKRVENLLLIGEDGVIQPIYVRPVQGGSDVEVAFPTRSAFHE